MRFGGLRLEIDRKLREGPMHRFEDGHKSCQLIRRCVADDVELEVLGAEGRVTFFRLGRIQFGILFHRILLGGFPFAQRQSIRHAELGDVVSVRFAVLGREFDTVAFHALDLDRQRLAFEILHLHPFLIRPAEAERYGENEADPDG